MENIVIILYHSKQFTTVVLGIFFHKQVFQVQWYSLLYDFNHIFAIFLDKGCSFVTLSSVVSGYMSVLTIDSGTVLYSAPSHTSLCFHLHYSAPSPGRLLFCVFWHVLYTWWLADLCRSACADPLHPTGSIPIS